MELLKQYFPLSFGPKKDMPSLVIVLLFYLVGMLAAGIAIWLLNLIPFVRYIGWVLGAVAEVYVVGGIVLAVLDYFKIIK